MIRRAMLTAALACAAPSAAQAPAAPPPPPPANRLLEKVGFVGSECVRHDAASDTYLVANIGPGANQGFVSRVSPDGQVTELKWIEGGRNGAVLERPLGLTIKGDTVYVADTKAVRLFDRRTGAAKGSIDMPGAIRLNDLAVADDGTIYVTDTGDDTGGALYVARRGKGAVWVARNDALERPNGIAIMPDGSIVHGGRGPNLVFRNRNGRILKERTLPTGRIDGIQPLADGSILVASQDGKNVYHVPAAGPPKVVAADIAVPAAIGFDVRRNRLLVPQIRLATLAFHDLPR